MISVKEAVTSAISFLTDLMAQTGSPISDIRVEEVELDDKSTPDTWVITLSFKRTSENQVAYEQMTGQAAAPREYKVLTLTAEDGEVLSMKMASQAGAA
jgi:hypothetical protein